jgi:hypothetical protein
MKNIFATQKEVELLTTQVNLHNWRFIGMEMEALGQRLDAAREALSHAQSDWAQWYWTETLDRLMIQWRHLPALHDGDATMTLLPRWTQNYEWWEGSSEPQYTGIEGLTDQLFEKIFRADNLDATWDRIRTERIMKCNCQ